MKTKNMKTKKNLPLTLSSRKIQPIRLRGVFSGIPIHKELKFQDGGHACDIGFCHYHLYLGFRTPSKRF